jgi:hypothetical protein
VRRITRAEELLNTEKGEIVMSKKSRARTDARRIKKPTPYCLDRQKLTTRQAALESRNMALFFLALVLLPLVLGLMSEGEGRMILWGIVVLVPVGTVYLIKAIRRHRLNNAIQKIDSTDETEICIHCTKVQFMTQRVGKYSSVIICIVLYDAKGEAFFYVYPKGDERTDYATETLKNSLVGFEITLACYTGTHIVKSFKNKHD